MRANSLQAEELTMDNETITSLDEAGTNPNFIINGDFNIWQRGTSHGSIATGKYSTDRFRYYKSGTVVNGIGRTSNTPTFAQSGHQSDYSLFLNTATADTMVGNDFVSLRQNIEGYNFQSLQGRTCTLSFWVRQHTTGIYCMCFQDSVASATLIKEYEIYVADTWEKKIITIDLNSVIGTWNYNTGVGLHILWILASGSDYYTTADSWVAGNKLCTSNQVNGVGTTNDIMYLSQVKFEVGQAATQFTTGSFEQELAKCQRYYEKSYIQSDAVPTNTSVGMLLGWGMGGNRLDMTPSNFVVTKRTTPTITIYNTTDSTVNQVHDYNNATIKYTVSSVATPSEHSLGSYLQLASAPGSVKIVGQWAADAEL